MKEMVSAVATLMTDIEIHVRENKDIKDDGQNAVLEFFYKLLAADVLEESVGLQLHEDTLIHTSLQERRIQGLKTKLPPAQHQYLEQAARLYDNLKDKVQKAKKELKASRELLELFYAVNDHMLTDKGTSVAGHVLQTILLQAVGATASSGVSVAAQVGVKSVTIIAKCIAEYRNEKKEEASKIVEKESKSSLTSGNQLIMHALAHQETDADLIKYFELSNDLLRHIGDIPNREDTYQLIHQKLGVYIPELKNTADIVGDAIMLKHYEEKTETKANVTGRLKYVASQIERLRELNEKLAATGILSLQTTQNLLNKKISLLRQEETILNKIIPQLATKAVSSPLPSPGDSFTPSFDQKVTSAMQSAFEKSPHYKKYAERREKADARIAKMKQLVEKIKELEAKGIAPSDPHYKKALDVLQELSAEVNKTIKKYDAELTSLYSQAPKNYAPALEKSYETIMLDYLKAYNYSALKADARILQGEKLLKEMSKPATAQELKELKKLTDLMKEKIAKYREDKLCQTTRPNELLPHYQKIVDQYSAFLSKCPAESAAAKKTTPTSPLTSMSLFKKQPKPTSPVTPSSAPTAAF